jgi:hypothetical protein
MPPNSYKIIFASDKDPSACPGELHARFGLSSDGETLKLLDANDTEKRSVTIPALFPSESYGTVPGSTTNYRRYPFPTPNQTNAHNPPARVANASQLTMNEISSVNVSVLLDENQESSDWFEVYNKGSVPIDMGGIMFRDSGDRWTVPAGVTIGPQQYVVLFASNKDRKNPSGELHTNFAIDLNGEQIYMLDADATPLEQPTLPPLIVNQTYGRFQNGTGPHIQLTGPTPGADNTLLSDYPGQIATPTRGTTLTTSMPTFSWAASPGLNVGRYQLDVADDPSKLATRGGTNKLFSSTPGASLSVTTSNIPINNNDVYVALWSEIGSTWYRSMVNRYHTSNQSGGSPAQITGPTPGSQWTTPDPTFTWTTGSNVTRYQLDVATTRNELSTRGGTNKMFTSGPISAQTVNVPYIKLDGNDIYAVVWSEISGIWQSGTIVTYSRIMSGDVNGDRTVDPTDAALVNAYFVGFVPSLTPQQIIKADVNRDTNIDPTDAAAINAFYVGFINRLPTR